MASNLTYDEWKATVVKLETPVDEVDLPETDIAPALKLKGGNAAELPDHTLRKVYHGLKNSRKAPRGKVRKALAGFCGLVKDAKALAVDLKGVHMAYLMIDEWASSYRTAYAVREATWAVNVATATYYAQVDNCKLHAATARARMAFLDNFAPELMAPVFQVAEAVKLLKRLRHTSKAQRLTARYAQAETPEEKKRIHSAMGAMTRAVLPQYFPRVEMWAGRVMMTSHLGTVLLSTGDLQRLEQYALSVMNMAVARTFSTAFNLKDPAPDLKWVQREAAAMSRDCVTVGRGNEVHVARAYKQAYAAALASKCGIRAGQQAQEKELMDMPFVESIGAVAHFKALKEMNIQGITDLGKIHKALPPPSSLGAATAYARYLKAREENPKRPVAAGRPPLDERLFEKCLRDEVARALRYKDEDSALKLKKGVAEPAWYPAWRDRKTVPLTPGWSESLDLRGAATVPARSDFSTATFKDSALAPDEPPKGPNDFAPKEHTNMAMRRFMDPNYPSVAEATNSLLSTMPRLVKGDQKPENFKHPLRLFYEAMLKDRMGVSQSEEAIFSVACHHPCYMIGKKPTDVQARAREMASPPNPGKSKRMFSFDVSNWSAGMAEKVQRISGRLWGEVFNDERIGSAYNVMSNANVYVQKHGFIGSYQSPTANFEGFDGKAMTMVHLALMSATVQRTREVTQVADLEASLMAYIDDGAAVLEMNIDDANRVFAEFMTCAEEFYGNERFVLHATKCMPSDRMFVFLNEVYYAGTHVVSATKAALKIASEPKQEHDSLPDRIMALTAGTQGAVQSGLPASIGALFCYFLCALELREWAGKKIKLLDIAPVAVALMFVSPAAYYGLAIPSMVGLDKTGKGASLSEGIAAMLSCAAAYPATAAAVVARLRTPLPPRSAQAILRNPTGNSGLSPLRTNRVAAALAERMRDIVANPTARQVMEPLWTVDLEGYAAALLETTTTITATTIQMAWKACPVSLSEAWLAKFESSKTIMQLLGHGVFKGIVAAQKRDALTNMRLAFELRT